MAYRPQIISLVQMLTTLDAYQSEFMIPYILSAQEFYKKESQKFSSGRFFQDNSRKALIHLSIFRWRTPPFTIC